MYNLEKMGFTRGIVEGAIVRMFQVNLSEIRDIVYFHEYCIHTDGTRVESQQEFEFGSS